MNLAAALLLGHLIADFPLQTAKIYALKIKSWEGVMLHAFIHVVVTALLIYPIQYALPLLAALGILHFITDYLKVNLPATRQWPGFLIDQGVHLAVLFTLAHQWQAELDSWMPLPALLLLITYTAFLGILVFLWVLACDLARGRWGHYRWVVWSRQNLLGLAQYAGVPAIISLVQYLYRTTART